MTLRPSPLLALGVQAVGGCVRLIPSFSGFQTTPHPIPLGVTEHKPVAFGGQLIVVL